MLDWAGQRKHLYANIAIRLTPTVIGIDVDHYNDKHGGKTLTEAENRWGTLPDTYRSTSRGTDNPSGIRFYRIPEGVELVQGIKFAEMDLGDIEICQFHHRYAVVWPSINPDNGERYRWYGLDGTVMDHPPALEDVPDLPAEWVDALTAPQHDQTPAEFDGQAPELLTEGEPSQRVIFKLSDAMAEIHRSGICRHDELRNRVLGLLRCGKNGEPGVQAALNGLCEAFVNRVHKQRPDGRREARQEFLRMVYGTDEDAAARRFGPKILKLLAETTYDEPFEDAETVTNGNTATTECDEIDTDATDHRETRIALQVEKLQEQAEARRRLKEIEAQQLCQAAGPPIPLTEFLAVPDTDAAYRINELLPIGGRAILSAKYKSGKTTMVDNLVRSLADNTLFLNTFKVRQARVVLLDTEMDERQMRRWLRQQDIENKRNVTVKPLRGAVSTFNILDRDVLSQWVDWLRGYDVVILDCLRPVLDALGLSEDKDAGRFLVAFDELLKRCGAGEAVVVDHMGHEGDRTRGDSRKLDWPDVTWSIVYDKDADNQDDPSRDRYFRAYGRDVDVAKGKLEYSHATRQLEYGLSRAFVKADVLYNKVIQLLTKQPKLTSSEIELQLGAFGTRQQIRNALKSAITNNDVVVETDQGSSHARRHFVNPSRKSE